MTKIFVIISLLLFLRPFDLHAGLKWKEQKKQQIKEEPTKQDVIDKSIEVYHLQPALFKAAELGKISEVKALLDKGEDTEVRGIFDGATPLMVASKQGHLEIVRLLLQAKAKNANAVDEEGNTPLMYAVRHPKIVKILLDDYEISGFFGYSYVRKKNSYGETALKLAIQWQQTESIRLLKEGEAKEAAALEEDWGGDWGATNHK